MSEGGTSNAAAGDFQGGVDDYESINDATRSLNCSIDTWSREHCRSGVRSSVWKRMLTQFGGRKKHRSPHFTTDCLLHSTLPLDTSLMRETFFDTDTGSYTKRGGSTGKPMTRTMKRLATRIFEIICKFAGEYSTRVDNEVTLAKALLQKGLLIPPIRDEIYCQLIKQTRQVWKVFRRYNQYLTLSLRKNSNPRSLLRYWKLIEVCAGTFLPSKTFEPYMLHYIEEMQESTDGDIRMVSSMILNAVREHVIDIEERGLLQRQHIPSMIEVQSILRNQKIFISIYSVDGTHKGVAITRSTTVEDATKSAFKKLHLPIELSDQFTLFIYDDSVKGVPRIQTLRSADRIVDILSQWESEYTVDRGLDEEYEPAKRFVLKLRNYVSDVRNLAPQLMGYYYMQLKEEVQRGNMVTDIDEILKMASLVVSVELGDHANEGDLRRRDAVTREAISPHVSQLIPFKMLEYHTESGWEEAILSLHTRHKGLSSENALIEYVELHASLNLYGCSFFEVTQGHFNGTEGTPSFGVAAPERVRLAIGPSSIFVLAGEESEIIWKYQYDTVYSWAYTDTSFALVMSDEAGRRQVKHTYNSSDGPVMYETCNMNVKLQITEKTLAKLQTALRAGQSSESAVEKAVKTFKLAGRKGIRRKRAKSVVLRESLAFTDRSSPFLDSLSTEFFLLRRVDDLEALGEEVRHIDALAAQGCKADNVPDDVSKCEKLQGLDISTNLIQFLPETLCRLGRLTALNCSDNKIRELPPLMHLTVLDASNNSLTTLPVEIFMSGSLRELKVTANLLRAIPREVGRAQDLTALDVTSNKLMSLPAEIGSLSSLQTLRAPWNRLVRLPARALNLWSGKEVCLSNNKLAFVPPTAFAGSCVLESLNISSNSLGKSLDFSDVTSLTHLRMGHNLLTEVSSTISCCSALRVLNLEKNRLIELPSEIWENFSLLEYLNVNGNPQLEDLPPKITLLKSLRILQATDCALRDIPALSEVSSLTELSLGRNPFCDSKPLPSNVEKVVTIFKRRGGTALNIEP